MRLLLNEFINKVIALEMNKLIDRTRRPLVNLIHVTPSENDYADDDASKLPYPIPMITSDSIVKSFSLDLLDSPHNIVTIALPLEGVNDVISHVDIPNNMYLCINDVCPTTKLNTDTIMIPKIISDSTLDVNAKKYIPFGASNSDNLIRYLIDNENSRLGAVVALSFALTIFIFKSLGFLANTSV